MADDSFTISRQNRYRLRFEKLGRIRFIGHLDLFKVFERAARAARLPLVYTRGFNPHGRLTLAQPLSLGHESRCEYAEMQLTRPIDGALIITALNAALPEGLRVTACRGLALDEKPAAALIAAAEYEILIPAGPEETGRLAEAARGLLSAESIQVRKRTKSGEADADIRPDIYSVAVTESGRLITAPTRAVMACGSARSLRPELLAGELLARAGLDADPNEIRYVRARLLQAENGGFADL